MVMPRNSTKSHKNSVPQTGMVSGNNQTFQDKGLGEGKAARGSPREPGACGSARPLYLAQQFRSLGARTPPA